MPSEYAHLPRDTNQVRGIAEYARQFCRTELPVTPSDDVDAAVYQRTELFHRDSLACAVSAIACRTNAPTVLRADAFEYSYAPGVPCLGSSVCVQPEKAIAANSSAAREWDSNGTNFGFNPARNATRGEFGHNDFYPVPVAAAQLTGADGRAALRGMVCLDEIRGRLAEAFGLKDHKIDHVVHGAIASAAVYGAMLDASVDQIESAIGMVVAHYIPFRAIRAGHQLSDSKGASAALSTEMAVTSVRRSMRGFVGPADIFRNPQAIFCLFEPPESSNESPFDLWLANTGDDFAVMGMHFKLGLYEHQSASAIHGTIELLKENPELFESPGGISKIKITIYEPAFSIIGDPAKRDPKTRQSADHSMVYIIATLVRKSIERKQSGWKELMLMPEDYSESAIQNPLTHSIMERIEFRHGGPEFDAKYPDGIPTTVDIETIEGKTMSSGLVMYPEGHARNNSGNLYQLLECKFLRLAQMGVADPTMLLSRFANPLSKTADEIRNWYDFDILDAN